MSPPSLRPRAPSAGPCHLSPPGRRGRRTLLGGAMTLGLAACGGGGFDMDLRDLGNGFDTTAAVRAPAADRPRPDSRGVISYPDYQVAVARRGDTVADVAARVGLPAEDLARFNGMPPGAGLNRGEILALPRRVAEPGATDRPGAGTIRPANAVDVAPLGAAGRPEGAQPVRHRVGPGETAFTIARRYGVAVSDLAAWNGLGRDRAVREGQHLLIPVAAAPAPEAPETAEPPAPGEGSPTPTPPSAAEPLPEEAPAPAAAPAEDMPESPGLAAGRTADADSGARMLVPVSGPIIRDFRRGRNDGIDISATPGAPVRAADGGRVAAITRDVDQVPIVVVRHEGGLLTVYAGVDDLAVEKGDQVSRGQTIARVRDADPAILHFEVRDGIEAVDPNPYLN